MLLQLFGYADMPLSENLQKIRKERGLNQEELAEIAGVSLTQISKIERNETDPRVSTVEKLAKALNCSTDQLLFDEKKEGLTGLLKRSFEKASSLEPMEKAALIKVINMACAGGVMINTMDEYYAMAQEDSEDLKNQGLDFEPEDLMEPYIKIEESFRKDHEEYHDQIDSIAKKETKKSHS